LNNFDHIDDYKAGKLSGEQLALFETALQSDESLRFAVENYTTGQQLSESLLEVDMIETLQQLKAEDTDPATQPKTRPVWVNFLVAAIVIALLSLAAFYMFGENEAMTRDEIMATYYKPPVYDMERGANPDQMTKMGKAKYAFATKEYDVSERLLNEILEADPANSEAVYYLGHINIQNNAYEKAATYFERSGFGDWEYQVRVVECLVAPGECEF